MKRGLFDGLEENITSPLFLAGAGLLSGEGFGGAMQGLQMGSGLQGQRRKQQQDQQRQQAFQQLTGPGGMAGLSEDQAKLANAMGANGGGFEMLAGALPKPRDALADEYTRAQIGALNRREDGGSKPVYKEIDGRLIEISPGAAPREVYASPDAGKTKQTPTELKAMFAAEDEIPNLDNTISALEAAKALNHKAYSGFGAETRANIGVALPERMQPQSARDSAEFNKIMSMEAIQIMAASLKGATTDMELEMFVELLGDPRTHPDIRGRTIDRMLSLSNAQKSKNQRRLEMLSGGGRYSVAPAAPQSTGNVPPQAVQALRSDPSPEAMREFNEVFGPGAAEGVLNGR